MDKVLKELCVEIASGDIGSERFNQLWIESGIPLEGSEFEVANLILNKAAESTCEDALPRRKYH